MTTNGAHEVSPLPETRPTSLLPDQPEVPPHAPIMDDLYDVGPDKPLGYLPNEAIYGYGERPEVVGDVSQRRGLSTLELGEEEAMIRGCALYVYDKKALDSLLGEQASMLAARGWPVDATEFVDRVGREAVDAEQDPELFRVIAWAFRDPRPEYKRPDSTPSGTVQPEFSARPSSRAKLLGWLSLKK
jgi:hypothetical protein